MKKLILLVSLAVVTTNASAASAPVWKVETVFQQPESAYYDPTMKNIFVSNVAGKGNEKDGKGWITRLDTTGKVLNEKWVEGLDAPKGLRAQGGNLWVSNIDEVVRIDIANAKIAERIKIDGAKFLNDIAVSDDGTVWVSDMLGNAIYEIRGGKSTVLMQGPECESPNGLLWQKGGKLLVAGWGTEIAADFSTNIPGHLYEIDLKTKKKRLITKKPVGHLDGLENDSANGYLVSDWSAGKVFRISAKGSVQEILSGFTHAADIGYISAQKTVLVPDMGASTVSAYKRF